MPNVKGAGEPGAGEWLPAPNVKGVAAPGAAAGAAAPALGAPNEKVVVGAGELGADVAGAPAPN